MLSPNEMQKKRGSLEVICGCMFSGKTEELIRRVVRAKIANRHVQAFKSDVDVRYSVNKIQPHRGEGLDAVPVLGSKAAELEKMISDSADVIAIDEIQFFDAAVAMLCDRLANSGKRVIVAGLDLDFRGEPFPGPMAALMSRSDKIDKLTAVCMICGEEPAVRSQRLINNVPARRDDPTMLVGAQEKYLAVCRVHHIIESPKIDKSYDKPIISKQKDT